MTSCDTDMIWCLLCWVLEVETTYVYVSSVSRVPGVTCAWRDMAVANCFTACQAWLPSSTRVLWSGPAVTNGNSGSGMRKVTSSSRCHGFDWQVSDDISCRGERDVTFLTVPVIMTTRDDLTSSVENVFLEVRVEQIYYTPPCPT